MPLPPRDQRGFVTEDEVAEDVAQFLIRQGGVRRQCLQGGAPGADVIVEWQGGLLVIEAKGGGSQRPSSKRFGQPFTPLQMKQSWDAAVAQLPQLEGGVKPIYLDRQVVIPDYLGIAVPDHSIFRMMFVWCRRRLEFLGDGVWFVSQDGTVTEALAPRWIPFERRPNVQPVSESPML